MVVLLLLMVGGIALTGWMQTTDAYWASNGSRKRTKHWIAIALHVVGVVHASLRHHESLVLAMINGRKRAPAGGDIL